MPLSLPGPADLLGLPRSVVDSLRSAAAALPRVEALPRPDDVLTRSMALLDRAPALTRSVPPLVDTASELLERLSAALTPERAAAAGALVDRLDAALPPARVEATAQALDALASRPDVLPRALEAIDRLASSDRPVRLGDALERVLSDPGLDRLLEVVADDRVERLLDLAADERLGRALEHVDVLLRNHRARRLLDRADDVLHDERLGRVAAQLARLLAAGDDLAPLEGLPSDDRVAAAARVFLSLDRALSAVGPEALTSLLERLPVLLTEERTAHLAALADRVPRMVSPVEGDLPSGPELRRMPADLHAMIEVLDDLHQVLSGMPGAARARARGEDPHPQVKRHLDGRPPGVGPAGDLMSLVGPAPQWGPRGGERRGEGARGGAAAGEGRGLGAAPGPVRGGPAGAARRHGGAARHLSGRPPLTWGTPPSPVAACDNRSPPRGVFTGRCLLMVVRVTASEETEPQAGFTDRDEGRPAAESVGERLLGALLDRVHLIAPRLVGQLIAQEARIAGATDVSIHLQDLEQLALRPLTGPGLVGDPLPIDDSAAGRAFSSEDSVEEALADGSVRLHLPLLDGSNRVGVLGFTLPRLTDYDRQLAQRLAGLVADMIVTNDSYTDTFTRVRTAGPLSLSAHMQWRLLPPLSMSTPVLDLAGVLEPAYEVGGDSFDYAFNEHVLHVAVFDAMGHGLEAATMATVVIAAYRHGRLAELPLTELYPVMDQAVATSFPGRFATAQLGRLDTETGVLSWVNAGHPPALWVRGGRVIGELTGPVSRPVGFGSGTPVVKTAQLQPGDRVLFFTDGVVEERLPGGEQFGEKRLRDLVEQTTTADLTCGETVRRLSHALMAARSGRTSDDASLLLLEWKGPPRDDELDRDIPEATPTG